MRIVLRLTFALLLALALVWVLRGVATPVSGAAQDEFTPSERLPAGSAVSFPVDI